MQRKISVIVITAALMIGSAGCSGSSSDDANEVRSSEELAVSLLDVGDMEGAWTVNKGPRDGAVLESGVVTDEGRGKLPTVDVCEAASQASREAAEKLEWQAFRQLNKTENDPVDLPTDREGHMEFVQEFLTSDEPNVLATMFDDLATGLRACLGELPAGEEGPGTVTEVEIEPVGDQRIAALTTVEEAGGEGTWYVYSALVRSGSVFMSVTVADIVLGDLEPELTVVDVNEILSTAVTKL